MSLATDLLRMAANKDNKPTAPVIPNRMHGTEHNTGVQGISMRKNKSRNSVPTYRVSVTHSGGYREYVGSFANLHSAIDAICKVKKCNPRDIPGVTPTLWAIVSKQPIIEPVRNSRTKDKA